MHLIFQPRDKNKDQTYFLWQIKPENLQKIIFPIAVFPSKQRLRQKAEEIGLPNSQKKDSQGLCFLGQMPVGKMLEQVFGEEIGLILQSRKTSYQKKSKKHKVLTWKNYLQILQENQNPIDLQEKLKTWIGARFENQEQKFFNILGLHKGSYKYTIGQRNNLGLSGGPFYVCKTDVSNRLVFVTSQNKDLLNSWVEIIDLNWHFSPENLKEINKEIEQMIENQTENKSE